jgi:superfamily II DNA or RNA helicase
MSDNCSNCGYDLREKSFSLRPYQERAIELFLDSDSSCVLENTGGTGKGSIAVNIMNSIDNDKVVYLTTISALIDDIDNRSSNKFNIIASGKMRVTDSNCYIAMEQTLKNKQSLIKELKGSIIIRDEGRAFGGVVSSKILDEIKPKKVLFLDATPYDNKGVAKYKGVKYINTISFNKAVSGGYLTPIKHIVPSWSKEFDIPKPRGDEYSSKEIESIFTNDDWTKKFVQWVNGGILENHHTLVVCSSIKMSELISNLIITENEIVHSKKNIKENTEIISKFKNGDIPVLISVSSLSIGFDAPIADQLIMLRPTTIRSLFYQTVFRIDRLHSSKKEAIHYDISGNLAIHGFPENTYIAPNSWSEAKGIAKELSLPFIKYIESEEINKEEVSKYLLKINDISNRFESKKLDLTELIELYDFEDDILRIIDIGAEIYRRLSSKVGNDLINKIKIVISDNRKIVLEKDTFDSAIKKRTKTIIKEDHKFSSLLYYPKFLLSDKCYIRFTINKKGFDEKQLFIDF